MAEPSTTTCAPWAGVEDVCAPCNDYDTDLGALADWLQVATDVLYELSGRRWAGLCTDTIRPPACCGLRWEHCTCGGVSAIELPGYPVVAITAVKIDGQVVAGSRYRIDNYSELVYLPEDPHNGQSRQRWPCVQDNRLPDTEVDTWSVQYQYGQAPPMGGVKAVAELGCQLSLSCSSDTGLQAKCRLPKRVTSITRQGVSMAILDPFTVFKDGLTGLPVVDLWLSSLRQGQRGRRSTVVVPGRRHQRPRRVTG